MTIPGLRLLNAIAKNRNPFEEATKAVEDDDVDKLRPLILSNQVRESTYVYPESQQNLLYHAVRRNATSCIRLLLRHNWQLTKAVDNIGTSCIPLSFTQLSGTQNLALLWELLSRADASLFSYTQFQAMTPHGRRDDTHLHPYTRLHMQHLCAADCDAIAALLWPQFAGPTHSEQHTLSHTQSDPAPSSSATSNGTAATTASDVISVEPDPRQWYGWHRDPFTPIHVDPPFISEPILPEEHQPSELATKIYSVLCLAASTAAAGTAPDGAGPPTHTHTHTQTDTHTTSPAAVTSLMEQSRHAIRLAICAGAARCPENYFFLLQSQLHAQLPIQLLRYLAYEDIWY